MAGADVGRRHERHPGRCAAVAWVASRAVVPAGSGTAAGVCAPHGRCMLCTLHCTCMGIVCKLDGITAPTHPPAHLPTADEMGLGKTLQTISLLSYLKFERGVQVSSRHDGLQKVGNWQMPIQEQRIAAGWGMFAGSWFALQLLILHMRACLCRRARTWWLCRSACCPAGSASSSDGVRRRVAGWRAAKP